MARLGWANCTASDFRAAFYPLISTCPSFEEASPEVIKARNAWAAKGST